MKKQYKINQINKIQELVKIEKFINENYGNILKIRIYYPNNYYLQFNSINEMINKFSNDDLKQVDNIHMSVASVKDEVYSIEINLIEQILEVKKNEIETKEKIIWKKLTEEEENKLLDGDNCDYYKFSDGPYVKYDYNDNLFYVTDEDYNWIESSNIIAWFYDSEHEYEVIKKKKGNTKKI
jgi:hypothetical protein